MRVLFSFVALLVLLLAACTAPNPTETPVTPTVVPSPTVAEPTPSPAVSPTPEASVTPVVILPVLVDATLPRLAEHTFTAGPIETVAILTGTNTVSTSVVTYLSDGVKISGLLNEPKAEGTYPGVVFLHGYVPPEQYVQGLDAQGAAVALAEQGYITLVPDLRGYADSDRAPNLFLSGWIADAINAGGALKQHPRVDSEHLGLWGHSMGGGIANRAMVVNDMFDAVVLYAPISGNADDMFMDPFGGYETGVTQELVESLVAAVQDPTFRARLSPIRYLENTTAPVSIHVGSNDNVTPPAWARAIRDGLSKASGSVEYFEYPGQGHTFQGVADQQFRARVLDFFDEHLK
jgi:dipeptidyl aminopeptidase/acylaminoacyl peptidase